MSVRKAVLSKFKEHGLMIQADACATLVSLLEEQESLNIDDNLQYILESIEQLVEKKEIISSVITLEIISSIIADVTSNTEDLQEESIQLIDAFSSPKLDFDEVSKSYKLIKDVKLGAGGNICGDINTRTNMFRRRLLVIRDRLIRSGDFKLRGDRGVNRTSSASMEARSGEHVVHEIFNIQDLLGSLGPKVLLGMLTQPKDGTWYLEDLTSAIAVDLSTAQTFSNMFTEGSIVVVQGELVSAQLFRVTLLGFPPAEERNVTLNAIGYYDTFGTRPQQLQSMSALESRATDVIFVIVSDLPLDKPAVLEKFNRLLSGFEQASVTPLFILMGSFVSSISVKRLNASLSVFTLLADTIAAYPLIAKEAKFVIIPGPEDLGDTICLPRKSIPAKFQDVVRKRVTHVTFGSNPCRIRFYTQEIVLFRENLVQKMYRHTPIQADVSMDVTEIADQVTSSVLDQAHLCPLPPQARPIVWSLDYTLQLTPLPHFIVIADSSVEAFENEKCGCVVTNPGSFARDSSFIVYRPAMKVVEISHLQ